MDTPPRILVVDDDPEIRRLLADYLGRNGCAPAVAADAAAARTVLEEEPQDLVVLDVMMPGEDGLSLCRWIRGRGELPVILLTALGEETDRVVGLELGADDYLVKPFGPRELLARVRSVLRRTGAAPAAPETDRLAFDGWVLDLRRRELTDPDGALVDLTRGEFDLLAVFARRPQEVLDRDALLDATRGREANPFDRSVDVQVGRLRRKIEADPARPALIKTVRGAGYLLTAAVRPA
ncbi:MAG: response regulator [Pseudomonadales bacterium]|jgi:two-component system OmpR family response regulator|nr:response regulator [Pseudomonadales bacterium]